MEKKYIFFKIIIIFILFILLCYFFLIGNVKTRIPSPLSRIYIDQVYEYNMIESKRIEIVDKNDIDFLMQLFSKKYIAYADSPGCPFGALRISFVFKGNAISFYPATDSCERIRYGKLNKYFEISEEDKELLSKIW